MVEIRIPPVLRPDAGGLRTVEVDAATVGEAIAALVDAHPSLEGRVRQGDGVPAFLNVFRQGEYIGRRQGHPTRFRPGEMVLLPPAVAGGA
jgi:molybdopterin converting factor small subunit